VLVLVTICAAAQYIRAERVEKNVVYGMYSGLALLMDIHYPDKANGCALVLVPGSGWTAPLSLDATPLKQTSTAAGDGPKRLADAGYTVFVVNHRATPRFQYPAPLEDVQRAVRFVRSNAANYHIDPTRIGAFGSSSGGHLVSMLGVLDGKGKPDDPDPINRVSAKVQTVVALFPAIDLTKIGVGFSGARNVALLLGAVIPPNAAPNSIEVQRYAEASPINYVTPDDPPFLIFHGDADPVVPFEQSQIMERALQKAGVPVKFVPVPGGNHGGNFGFKPGDPRIPDYWSEAIKWFDRYLRNQPSN
jgi:acetyl esterase/lipase